METRNDFMNFFRNPEKMALLSVDDRLELFEMSLTGASDITVERLNRLLVDYDVDGIEVKAIAPPVPKFEPEDIVYYVLTLPTSRRVSNTPLEIFGSTYMKANDVSREGFYYTFSNNSHMYYEGDLSRERPRAKLKNVM